MTAVVIDRAYVRIAGGLVHYRTASPIDAATDDAPPIYLAHAGPGSSRGLEELIVALADRRRVVAPDMMGNGDSDPPPVASTDLAFYADCAVAVLDGLGIARVDFYGQHTGAHVGCELALRHPARVRRLVLDGIALFSEDERREMRERYAPLVEADAFGGHLAWAWHFVAGLFVHFPYYREDPTHRLNATAVPPPAIRQRLVVDLLKALPTYHLAYRAVFGHDTAARLPRVVHPTLLMAVDGDPLAVHLAEAERLLPRAEIAVASRETRNATVRRFFAS